MWLLSLHNIAVDQYYTNNDVLNYPYFKIMIMNPKKDIFIKCSLNIA